MSDLQQLPTGWSVCVIDEVVAFDGLFKDGDWVESKDQDPDGDVRLIQLADIGDGWFIDKSSRFLTTSKAHELNCTFLKAGDLLVARMPDPLGRCCVFPLIGENKFVTVVDVCAIRLGSSPVSEKYLMYLINSPSVRSKISALQSGSTRKRISRKNLATVPLTLAPVNEQHRIVAKIETLFSELDKGIEALKTAREQLKVYRQAVLKHAFEGKLTAQWREDNKGKLESPDQLLARIQQEREARYQQQLKEWQAAVKAWEENGKEGKKPRKPKRPVVVPPVTIDELSVLPSLPGSWVWIRPEQIAAEEDYAIGIGPFGSNLKVSDYRETGVPLIFVRNITRSDFSSGLKYIDHEKFDELIPHSVKPLDLVITKMGDPPGDCEIYPKDKPVAVLTADCLKFRVFEEFADRRFYKNCMNSNMVKRQLGLITKGVAQKKISVDRFKTILIPLPPIGEQHAVAERIEEVFSVITNQEATIVESLERSEALRQSILKKAFSGQLVLQDPNDEPASTLLERISAKKGAQAQRKGVKTVVKKNVAKKKAS